MYFESYGNHQKDLVFIAVRFTKPILRLHVKENLQPIDTDNILVIYSKQNSVLTKFNTLTFGVKTQTNGIYVDSGDEANLLKNLFNDPSQMYVHVFHDSVLYVVGSNKLTLNNLNSNNENLNSNNEVLNLNNLNSNNETLNLNYEKIPKNRAFKALFNIVKSCLDQTLGLGHFQYCKYFKRNHLKWQKWSSWWYVVQKCINMHRIIPEFITLQFANQIATIFKNSQKNFDLDYSNLYMCEIELAEKPFLGVAYRIDGKVSYLSPMIVSKFKSSFRDVNYIECTHWLPLYFNKIAWLSEGLYFYLKNLTIFKKHLRQILNFLNDTTIEKYLFIKKDLQIVYDILNT